MTRYIDAEKLKNFDFNKIFDYKASYEICLGIETVLMIAEKMPSADVQEVKHGVVIPTFNMDGGVAYETCSVCGTKFYTVESLDWWSYCPHCGARMDGEEDAGT